MASLVKLLLLVLPAVYSVCVGGAKNDLLQAGEECDVVHAGCSATCTTNPTYVCWGGHPTINAAAYWTTCREICGDGIRGADYACDDGNTQSGDGCSEFCAIELGFTCAGAVGALSVCSMTAAARVCGNGRVEPPEQCDDFVNEGGVAWNGDGCSTTCTIEVGFECSNGDLSRPSECWEICGDGLNYGFWECDDSNTKAWDGCDESCWVEYGHVCTGGSPTFYDTCTELCGDGRNIGILECDDGNLLNNDGCSSTCQIERGYTCEDGDWF